MIELNLYRSRIGLFNNCRKNLKSKLRKLDLHEKCYSEKQGFLAFKVFKILIWVVLVTAFLQRHKIYTPDFHNRIYPPDFVPCNHKCSVFYINGCQAWSNPTYPSLTYHKRGKRQAVNFQVKLLHGNIGKGIKNINVKIRSV